MILPAKKTADYLLAKGLIDPAFAYAMIKLETFVPNPGGSTRTPHPDEQNKWNMAVDEYIALGCDGRSKIDIERAAKVGRFLGAMFKTCEGPGCDKMEGRDVEKLKTCAKCKLAVYCDSKCQLSAWKSHKPACGGSDEQEQRLPSQAALNRYVLSIQENAMNQSILGGIQAMRGYLEKQKK